MILSFCELLKCFVMEPFVFQFVPIASCPGTEHCWKESGSILFAHIYQVFVHTDKISVQPPLGWTVPIPLLLGEVLQSFDLS